MGAAPETAQQTEIEDFLFWEMEMMHPPEDEIYGRSLSTIRRLGAFMIRRALPEIISSPEAAQAKAEFFTSVEEGFATDKELGGGLEVRDFDPRKVIDGKVMSKDLNRPISAMTKDGLECAIETAKKDDRFFPQLIRSHWDHKNALAVDEMAQGETAYNTRIVVSPFPEEAAKESGNKYWRSIGYVPHLKRGFVQLYHMSKDGEFLAGSLSFDGSNKQKIREIFSRYGVQVPTEEITDNLLKYALTAQLSEDEAKLLATAIADQLSDKNLKKTTNTVDVTREYGPIMDQAFNESYIHVCESLARGYQTEGVTGLIHQLAGNAHHFNERYRSALYRMRSNKHEFTDGDSIVLHELLVYSTIEMMRALHLEKQKSDHNGSHNSVGFTATQLQTMDTASFQNMLSDFGADGARNNRGYSACGIEIFAGGDNPNRGDSPQSAFGGLDNNEVSKKKMMNCPFCSAKVFDDPCAAILCCRDCNARVVNGRLVSKGNGGRKAREAKARAAAEEARKTKARSNKEAEAPMTGQVDDVFKGVNVEVLQSEVKAEQARRSAAVPQLVGV